MAGFLFIDGIPGQSVDSQHQGWINLLSVSEAISRPVIYGGSGSSRNVGSAQHGDIVLTKELDKSTPKIIEAMSAGKTHPSVKIDLVQSLGDTSKRVPYLQWELKQVIITSYSISANVADGSATPPQETFSLNFEEAKWTYSQYKKDGSSEGKVEATWKLEEGNT